MEEDFLFKQETDKIISTFYEVYNSLGYGFLERVYQNAQTNYLKATNIELGLLLNFGEKPQVKRKIFENKRKENLRSSAASVSSVCHNENDDEE